MKKRYEFNVFVEEYKVSEIPEKHPSLFETKTIVLGICFGVLGIIIGLELLTRVGITPNTSIIAAIIAIAMSRIPMTVFRAFRSLPRQNLMQTVISGATFGGANAIFLPMCILWLLGKTELVPAMMLGAILGLIIDATILYYGNGLFHVNSIMQPCTASNSPVVGVAITAETAVPGCATGASREIDIEEAARFCIEVAKAYTEGKCRFYNENEFNKMVKLYGPMNILQTLGKK